MFFGLDTEKIFLIGVFAVLIIGPQRLPAVAKQFAQFLAKARVWARDAKGRLKEEFGDDLDEVEWRKLDPRQYDPRRIMREALLEEVRPTAPAVTTPAAVAAPVDVPVVAEPVEAPVTAELVEAAATAEPVEAPATAEPVEAPATVEPVKPAVAAEPVDPAVAAEPVEAPATAEPAFEPAVAEASAPQVSDVAEPIPGSASAPSWAQLTPESSAAEFSSDARRNDRV